MIRTRLFAFALVLALAVGPVAAACADCCPQEDGVPAVAAAADCCGNCGETLDRAPERASAALRAATPDFSVAVAVSVAPSPGSPPTPVGAFADSLPLACSPPRAFAPLRL